MSEPDIPIRPCVLEFDWEIPDPEQRFTGLPILTETIDGQTWRLARDVSYRLADRRVSTVRTGFEFDFASVPRIFWVLLPPTGLPDQPYGIAALIHDWLCRHRAIAGQPITRAECDRVFREVMEYVGVNKRIAATMYWAVRLAAIVAGIR